MYYFDRCLAMGLSSSCAIFEAFSTALEWLSLNPFGTSSGFTYFRWFSVHSPKRRTSEHDLENFILMCNYLGVPLAPKKTVGHATTLQFTGISLDSVRQEARLPGEKLKKMSRDVERFPGQPFCLPKRITILNMFIEFYMPCQERQKASSSHWSFARR